MFIIQIYLHSSILKGVTGIISQHVDHLLFIIIIVNIRLMKLDHTHILIIFISPHTSLSTKLASPHLHP